MKKSLADTQVNRDLSDAIRIGYQPTDGCPPLSSHWGGKPLSDEPWLSKFADNVAEVRERAQAWRKLEGHCDVSELIELLYLYTLRRTTLTEEGRESYSFLKTKLDTIIPAYDDLIHRLSKLAESPQAAMALTWDSLSADIGRIVDARNHAVQMRQHAASWGSNKTNDKDWYLVLMASAMKKTTGSLGIPTLLSLLDAAREAHGEARETMDEELLKKRIQRYRKRFNQLLSQSSSSNQAPEVALSEVDNGIPF